jgi:iron complex outermembrane recepter protein
VELSARNSLRPLGEWGRHFTVFANATKLDVDGEQEANFDDFIPLVVHWGVTATRKPFTVVARWNYRGKQRQGEAPAIGPEAYNYAASRLGMDVNVSYQPGRRVAYFVNARNLLNRYRVVQAYAPVTPHYAKTSLSSLFGVQVDFGVRGTF